MFPPLSVSRQLVCHFSFRTNHLFNSNRKLCYTLLKRYYNNYREGMAAKTATLNNGRQFPVLGFGTWQSKPGEVGQAVKDAIDSGYRHIDCAHVYGNEKEVGAAINAKINEGAVKREELFITSKLWNTRHRPGAVLPACQNTLSDLGLDYLDLYLIHWPFAFKEGEEKFPLLPDKSPDVVDIDYVDTWKAMEELVQKGLVKSIGISNFNSVQTKRILDAATIKPVTNQVECHPYLNQKKLIKFSKDHDIIITAYSPLGNPGSQFNKPGTPKILEDPKLQELAKKYGKTVAQVVLRYLIQIGTVPIPKSVTKSRIQENINVFDFELSSDEVEYIDSLNRDLRTCGYDTAAGRANYPFEIEF